MSIPQALCGQCYPPVSHVLGLDELHPSALGRGKGAPHLLEAGTLRTTYLQEITPGSHHYRYGVWSGILKTKRSTKTVSKPVNLPLRGTSTAQGNPDSHRQNILWRWSHNQKVYIPDENNCKIGKSINHRIFGATKENRPQDYSSQCRPQNIMGRRHSVVKDVLGPNEPGEHIIYTLKPPSEIHRAH